MERAKTHEYCFGQWYFESYLAWCRLQSIAKLIYFRCRPCFNCYLRDLWCGCDRRFYRIFLWFVLILSNLISVPGAYWLILVGHKLSFLSGAPVCLLEPSVHVIIIYKLSLYIQINAVIIEIFIAKFSKRIRNIQKTAIFFSVSNMRGPFLLFICWDIRGVILVQIFIYRCLRPLIVISSRPEWLPWALIHSLLKGLKLLRRMTFFRHLFGA